jgi:UDP-N-acetyl-D-glucosamine dehydrogenase
LDYQDVTLPGASHRDPGSLLAPLPPGRSRRRRAKVVAVVGLGYVGLPTSLAFTAAGADVLGIDIDPGRLAAIAAGEVDLLPADRERLPAALNGGGTGEGQLSLSANLDEIRGADAVLICVPTPIDAHLVPDLDPLAGACRDVAERARRGQLIVLTSTSYVGTTRDLLVEPLERRGLRPGRDVHVVFAPERIDPANGAFPQQRVPRIVGGVTGECARRAAELIEAIAGGVHVVGSPEVAELAKLYENTFRAVNISLANELADVCGVVGTDPIEVIDAAATKPYGFMPFYPGAGVGGHCIPVDPHYLLWQLRARGISLPVVEQAMTQIAARPTRTGDRVLAALAMAGIAARGSRVLVGGVAYKPGVADARMSPALGVIARLESLGVDVSFHDPLVGQLTLGGRTRRSVPLRAGDRYDAVVLHTQQPGMDLDAVHARVRVDCTYRRWGGAVVGGPGGRRQTTGVEILDLDAFTDADGLSA